MFQLPSMDTTRMSKRNKWRDGQKQKRKIGRPTVRTMQALRHSKMEHDLKHRCANRPDSVTRVHDATECHSSSTCPCCFTKCKDLGGSRVFVCKKCRYTCPRDIKSLVMILKSNISCVFLLFLFSPCCLSFLIVYFSCIGRCKSFL